MVVSLTVIVARFVWVFPATYLPRWLSQDPRGATRRRRRGPSSSSRGRACAASSRSRPPSPWRPDFPQRSLILYLTFCVILATLVGQGLTLPWLIRQLGVTAATEGAEAEETHARLAAVEAALQRLEDLRADYPDHLPLIDAAARRAGARGRPRLVSPGTTLDEAEQELLDHRAIRAALLVAQREAVIQLRDDGRHQRRDAAPDRARPGPRGAPGRGLTGARWYPPRSDHHEGAHR